MKANKFLFFTLFFFTSISVQSFAQKESEPLKSFLLKLEDTFQVVFSYADKNIQGVNIVTPSTFNTLEEYLQEIEKQTDLDFSIIDSRYITIQKKSDYLTVSGIIIDANTNEAIVGAIIYSGKNYVLSDDAGFFQITLNREEKSPLLIRHTSYSPLELEKKFLENDPAIYKLIPKNQVLEEIVINYIAKGIDKLSDGSFRLNLQNIEVLPGLSEPDVLQTVQVLPGIQSLNESVANINTRGGTNDQSLILWDGVKLYQPGHFFGLISAFDSHLIHETRIIKNGANATYDEGVSGIIDMQQQDFLISDFEVSTGINMMSGDIVMKIPVTPKLSLILGGRHSINEWVKTPTYNSYFNRAFENTSVFLNNENGETPINKNDAFSFYDLSFKLLYNLTEKDKIRLSFLNIDNSLEYEESDIQNDILQSRTSSLSQSSMLTNLSFTHAWNENQLIEMSAYYSGYSLDGTNLSSLDDELHLQKNEVNDWGMKLGLANKISSKHSLSVGYQFKEVGIRNLDNIRNPGYFRDVKDVLRIHALYAETEVKELFEKIYLRTGLRTNYFPKFHKFLLEPSVIINYQISNNFSVEAIAEKNSQHTTQLIDYQTDFLGVEKRRWVLSNNTSIPLIKSQQFSLGLQHDQNNLLISLETYRKNVSGIISPSQGFQNQFQSAYSIGEYKTHGVELLINKRLSHSNIWANYTYAENDYYFKDFTPSVFPNNFDVKHTISLGGIYTINQFELSAGMNYRTGRPETKPISGNSIQDGSIIYEEPNSSRLKDYLRIDISAEYEFNISTINGKFGLSVWNILDRKNDINTYYHQNDGEIEQITQNALGLTPNISLRLSF